MAFTHYRTYGFVFKKDDQREADRLFTIFTKEYGTIKVLGRGIRKTTSKLNPNINIFSLIEFEFIQGKNYKTLTDTLIIERYEKVESNSKKLETAFNISQVLNSFLFFEEKDERILSLLVDCFRKLEKIDDSLNWLLFYCFLWNLLSFLGYHPELYNCSLCQNKLIPQKLSFSSLEGGIICKNCKIEKVYSVSPETIKILRIILKNDWNTLKKIKVNFNQKKEIMKISKIYYFYLINKK